LRVVIRDGTEPLPDRLYRNVFERAQDSGKPEKRIGEITAAVAVSENSPRIKMSVGRVEGMHLGEILRHLPRFGRRSRFDGIRLTRHIPRWADAYGIVWHGCLLLV
jgi:hypothetical protein